MSLVDRYVTEVGKHLPLKSRADIEKELKSTLEDMLVDRGQQAGQPRDQALEMALLKEYGAPEKVAASYNLHPYLIGPRLYPIFILVLKIVFSVLSILALIGLGIALSKVVFASAEFWATLGKTLGAYLGGAISAFGNIVLVFAILDRTLPDTEVEQMNKGEDWDPAQLLTAPDPDLIKRSELIVEIVFTIALLVILNVYPQWLGINFFVDGQWFSTPLLSATFFQFVPWISALGLIEIGLNLYLLRQNIWQPLTRLVQIGVDVLKLGLTIMIFRAPNIFGMTPASFANVPLTPETAQTLMTIFNMMSPFILIIIVIIQGIEVAKGIFRFWKLQYQTK